MTDKAETVIIEHSLADGSEVGITTHFWLEAGRGPIGRYRTDTMILRVYVDNETNASLTFTPSMAAGSGVGLESQVHNIVEPTRQSFSHFQHHRTLSL